MFTMHFVGTEERTQARKVEHDKKQDPQRGKFFNLTKSE